MNSSRKSKSTKKRCLLCRARNMLTKLLPPKLFESDSSHAEQKMMDDVGENGTDSCIDSVCTILRISKSHPFRHFFLNASYCQDCIRVLKEIDFTLKSAKTLQQKILGLRQNLFAKFCDNYGAIENKDCLAAVRYKEIECLANRAKTTFQYDEVIKLMYDKLCDIKHDWTSVDFLEQKECILDSRISVQTITSEIFNTEPNSDCSGDESTNQKSIRLRRRKQKINYCENADESESKSKSKENVDSESDVFDHEIDPDWSMSDSEPLIDGNDDEDFKPRVASDDLLGPTSRLKFFCSDESCCKGFEKEEELRVHERKVHEDDPSPYHCELCDQKYRYARGLAEHVKSHNISHLNSVDCPECGKSLKQSSLDNHIRKVHQKHQKHCSFCEKEFKNEEELLEHENTHKNSDQPFKCVTCDATFTNTANLKQHMRTHSNSYQVCDVCGKRFKTVATLQFHRKSHDESRIGHRCPECGRDCQSKAMLETHMLVHSTEKKFICDVCGAVFKHKKGLNLHYRNHTGDFPFVCKVCGKRFIASHYLKNHEEIHSGILAYECNICHKKFRAKKNLQQHEKTHEPKDPNRKPRDRHINGKGCNEDEINRPDDIREMTNQIKLKSVKRKRKHKNSPTSESDDKRNDDSNDKNYVLLESQTADKANSKSQKLSETASSSSTNILMSQSSAAISSQSAQHQQQYCYHDPISTVPLISSMYNANVGRNAHCIVDYNPSYSPSLSNSGVNIPGFLG